MCSLAKCCPSKKNKTDSDLVLLENTIPPKEEEEEDESEPEGTESQNELPNSFFNLHGSQVDENEMPNTPRYCFSFTTKNADSVSVDVFGKLFDPLE